MTRLLPILFPLVLAAQPLPPMPVAVPEQPSSPSVTLAWDASPDHSWVTGYTVYQGGESRNYTTNYDAGMGLQYTVTNLTRDETYFWAVTAMGTNGLESDFSNEVEFTIPEPTPKPVALGLRTVVVLTVEIEGADGASGPWRTVASIPLVVRDAKPNGVFRAKLRAETMEGIEW